MSISLNQVAEHVNRDDTRILSEQISLWKSLSTATYYGTKDRALKVRDMWVEGSAYRQHTWRKGQSIEGMRSVGGRI